jgi:predicted Fe-Mo cluster-binding NifX family protein
VTGNIGPKAFSALQAGGIKIFTQAGGLAKDAFQRFKAGELGLVEGPNVAGHWM